jgi:hypothetical protein
MINALWKRQQLNKSHSLIKKAAQDLIRKGLVPEYTHNYIMSNLHVDAQNRNKDHIKNTSCPICGINLPSRFLMRQHVKIHGQAKDNEPFVVDTKPYFS